MVINETCPNDYDELLEARNDYSTFFNEIDETTACTTKCPGCGNWMHYEGFINRSIYAFVVCAECKIAWSF